MAKFAYVAHYAHSDTDTPGELVLSATNDDEAINEAKNFVADGYCNGTWINVDLATGLAFSSRNSHGIAI